MQDEPFDCLSVWEIAHRWDGEDPDGSEGTPVPYAVQKTLRVIMRAMARHELASFTEIGVEQPTNEVMPSFMEWMEWHGIDPAAYGYRPPVQLGIEREAPRAKMPLPPPGSKNAPQTQDSESPKDDAPDQPIDFQTLDRRYVNYVESETRLHKKYVEGFDEMVHRRRFDKERLDTVYLTREAVRGLCEKKNIPLPSFWFGHEEERQRAQNTPQQEPKLRPSQLAKKLCQSVASTLWDEYPQMTIADMVKHPSVLNHGGGAHYEPRTLREWVRAVDPRSKEEKTGRPSKNPPPE